MILRLVSLAAVAALLTPSGTAAQERPRHHTQVSLLAEVDSVQPGVPFWVGLRMLMDEHWHTYWENPGDTGLPTRIAWSLPEGFEAGPLESPAPERQAVGPLVNYGYEGEVIHLIRIQPPDEVAGDSVTLHARVNWLECEEICIPAKADLELSLSVRPGPIGRSVAAPLFDAARERLPREVAGWSFEAGQRGETLSLVAKPPAGVAAPAGVHFYVRDLEVVDYAAPQKLVRQAEGFRVEIGRASNPADFEGLRGILVVEADDGSQQTLEVVAEPSDRAGASIGTPGVEAPGAAPAWLVALGFAFIGGLILNLMPCVLPVLSLKVLGFVRDSANDEGGAWRHGLAFTMGVLSFFWILALALLALRAGGEQVGWGFQLQSPAFVVFLACLFFAIGLNLFGVFEIGQGLTAAGQATVGKSGLAGSFWSGALATVIATPCTAPFMGSALGFTLDQPAWVSLTVFTSLGLGMASPYLVLSLFPALVRFVPKPGEWMETFKQVMGFPIMATVIYLVWLFGRQTGLNAVGLLLGGLLLIALGAWIYGRGALPPSGRRVWANVMAAVFVLIGLALGFSQAQASPQTRSEGGVQVEHGIAWEPFSPARVAELRAAGTPVFIDFTADWCLTCQVNEAVAFTDEVRERFEQEGVAMLKADWTLRDDVITQALAGYGRRGVPVYVLYGRDPGAEPHLLPEVLSPGIVLDAMDEVL